jgi:hypothetical protein
LSRTRSSDVGGRPVELALGGRGALEGTADVEGGGTAELEPVDVGTPAPTAIAAEAASAVLDDGVLDSANAGPTIVDANNANRAALRTASTENRGFLA